MASTLPRISYFASSDLWITKTVRKLVELSYLLCFLFCATYV